jgi:anti-sigma regulatory factor (Ser/Thr protein kinase)
MSAILGMRLLFDIGGLTPTPAEWSGRVPDPERKPAVNGVKQGDPGKAQTMTSVGEASRRRRLVSGGQAFASGEPALEMTFGIQDLLPVRRLIGSFALEAGLTGVRTEEVVLVVNEIATNAVIHGGPPSKVRAWTLDDEIVVEVADAGDGIRDVNAGRIAPMPDQLGGRGLWLTRRLCDDVEVRNDNGCIVTMHIAAPGGPSARAA